MDIISYDKDLMEEIHPLWLPIWGFRKIKETKVYTLLLRPTGCDINSKEAEILGGGYGVLMKYGVSVSHCSSHNSFTFNQND